MKLISAFEAKYTEGVGVKFLLGNSAGARFTFALATHAPDKFDVLVPVGTDAIPNDDVMDELERHESHGQCDFRTLETQSEQDDDTAPDMMLGDWQTWK